MCIKKNFGKNFVNHQKATRLNLYYKTKIPGCKVIDIEYLTKEELQQIPYLRTYSVPKRFRKPGKLAWTTPKGFIRVKGVGLIREPPVLEVKFYTVKIEEGIEDWLFEAPWPAGEKEREPLPGEYFI